MSVPELFYSPAGRQDGQRRLQDLHRVLALVEGANYSPIGKKTAKLPGDSHLLFGSDLGLPFENGAACRFNERNASSSSFLSRSFSFSAFSNR